MRRVIALACSADVGFRLLVLGRDVRAFAHAACDAATMSLRSSLSVSATNCFASAISASSPAGLGAAALLPLPLRAGCRACLSDLLRTRQQAMNAG